MSIKITKHRRMVEEKSYTLSYDRIDMPGAGFAFPCDEHGVLAPMLPMAQSSYEECQSSGEYNPPYIQTFVRRYSEPAEAICHCGRTVYLEDPMDNECDCGRCFNMSGREVLPMSACRDHDDY